MIDPVQIELLMHEFDDPWPEQNPAEGGRAGLGVVGGITMASFAAAAYMTLTNKWDSVVSPRKAQIGEALLFSAAAPAGAALGALPGSRRAAAIGALTGVLIAEVPLVIWPHLVREGNRMGEAFALRPGRRILGWAWTIGIPVIGAIVGVNVAQARAGQ